MLYIFKQQLIP